MRTRDHVSADRVGCQSHYQGMLLVLVSSLRGDVIADGWPEVRN